MAIENREQCSGIGFITCVQSDTVDLADIGRQIRFNAGGTCKIGAFDGSTYSGTFTAGEQLTIQVRRIYDTGTSIADADICIIK